MHHKRHALELIELFKQSRQTVGSSALAEPAAPVTRRPQFERSIPENPPIAGGERTKVQGFSPMDSKRMDGSTPPHSYLPRVTPVQKRQTAMNIRKDTIIVGAVFVLVFSGLSFLIGRRSTLVTETPVAKASIPFAGEPIVVEAPAPVTKTSVAIVSPAPEVVKKAEELAPPKKPEPRPYTHIYQCVTTGHDEEGAREYEEFLKGMGYNAFCYQTQKGRWTVRVRSNDSTRGDLDTIQGLTYHSHSPFSDAYKLAVKTSN